MGLDVDTIVIVGVKLEHRRLLGQKEKFNEDTGESYTFYFTESRYFIEGTNKEIDLGESRWHDNIEPQVKNYCVTVESPEDQFLGIRIAMANEDNSCWDLIKMELLPKVMEEFEEVIGVPGRVYMILRYIC